MRITQALNRQHLDFMFKRHWKIQGKRIARDSGAETVLAAKGINIRNATDLMQFPLTKFPNLNIVGAIPRPVAFDETHPLWIKRQAYIYTNKNAIIEGLKQAQILTKTVVIPKLPLRLEEELNKTKIPENIDKSMQEAVITSHVLDAQQVKTAIVKDPLRPAFVLPRIYGISDSRKNKLIISKLLLHCERMAGRILTSTRAVLNNGIFNVTYEKEYDLINLKITVETCLCSKQRIELNDKNDYNSVELPNLNPLKATISLDRTNIYEPDDVYPIASTSLFNNPHTLFLHYSPEDVKNVYGTPVTENQIESRNLLKAFAVAASKARNLYGNNVKDLPTPIVVQSIQTDGKSFYFGIFQLKTLNLNENGLVKNCWYMLPKVDLFSECSYKNARPYLGDYNGDVLKLVKVFYNNN